MTRSLIFLFALLLGGSQIFGQGKAKIIIKKNIDGEETVIEKEYDLEDGDDLGELLHEEEFDMEFDFDDDMMSSFFHFDFDDEGEHHPYKGNGMHRGGPFLGITQERSSEDGGVLVSRVIEESTAEEMGMESGDLIVEFNGSDVHDMADLKRLLGDAEVGDEVKVEVEREGKRKKLKGTLKEQPEMEQGMRWMFNSPDSEFEFDSQMNMAELQEMMRQMEERMQDMELEFDMPDGDLDGLEKKYRFQYDVPGRYRDLEGSSLRFDQISSEDADRLAESTDLSLADDLALNGMRLRPIEGSSIFELEFSLDEAEDLSLTIYDSEGKMVYYEMLGDFSGDYENVIDLYDRPAGDYFLKLAQDGKTFCRKIIKG